MVARVKQTSSANKKGTDLTTHGADEAVDEDNTAEVQREYSSITGAVPGLAAPPKASAPSSAATPAPRVSGGGPEDTGDGKEKG